MSRRKTENNVTENNVTEIEATTNSAEISEATFAGVTFNREKMLEKYAFTETTENGVEVTKYSMQVDIIDEKIGEGKMTITDPQAIEAIEGLRNSEKLEKWASYRKGAYLVELVNSSFMTDNDISSVEKLAKMINLGVEGSSANSLENVARRLGVSFNEQGNLSFADSELPLLSFWHYNNIISLVTQNDDGSYNYDSLKDFLRVANVTPLMSQKKVKELFNDYRNGRLSGSVAIPDKVKEKANKEAKKAAENKLKAEKAKATVSAKTAIENAKTFVEKKAVSLSALEAFEETIVNLGVTLDIDFDTMKLLIVEAVDPAEKEIDSYEGE